MKVKRVALIHACQIPTPNRSMANNTYLTSDWIDMELVDYRYLEVRSKQDSSLIAVIPIGCISCIIPDEGENTVSLDKLPDDDKEITTFTLPTFPQKARVKSKGFNETESGKSA